MKTIAIVGRPNVGKSSLFNELIRQRKAIIDPTPGVTRDILTHVITIHDRSGILVDTGGITDDYIDSFTDIIIDQTKKAIAMADALVFVVEVGQLVPDDYRIGELLRETTKPVVLVVNKVDNEQRELWVSEAYELGLGDPLDVSAAHRKNLGALEEKLYELIEPSNEEAESSTSDESILHISIIGKPNVGKSTLLNLLLGYERALVSDIAGTTRDSIDERVILEGKHVCFIDTAGIRRKSSVEEQLEFYSINRALKSIERSQVVLHLIDSVEHISTQDKKIAGIAMNSKKALIFVVNKWDLQTTQDKRTKTEYIDWIRFRFAVSSYIPIIPISCHTGFGINQLRKAIFQIYGNYVKRVETAKLNQALEEWITRYPPPGFGRQQLKILYGSQINTAPPRFSFSINHQRYLTDNYRSYLTNCIRDHFGFEGVPITLLFRDRRHNKK
jgi:GTPase